MIIKKFVAETEQEAMLKAKDEMGPSAVVLNIKTTKHKGIRKLFKKDTVEVTAALEEKTTGGIPTGKINVAVGGDLDKAEELGQRAAIEQKLDNLQQMLEKRMDENVKKVMEEQEEVKSDREARGRNDENTDLSEKDKNEQNLNISFIKLIYNQLIDNEVEEKYANQLIAEIESVVRKESTLDTLLASVYQKIVLKLGNPKPIELNDKHAHIAFFVGPTGVGKTTTIAKIASDFKLEKDKKVAMITSDTYRIAAIEQLKTYANILSVPVTVVFTVEELNEALLEYKDYDLVLVDTAGRSHKNQQHCEEMLHFIKDSSIPRGCTKDIYMVLSAATKYKDLLDIVDVYGQVGKYNIVFTKLDETSAYGNILNVRLKTQANFSYVTTGQTVPDDIRVLDAQNLAKSLLGGVS